MYYIYIKNIGVLKKIKPYKLYGIYKTAPETNDAISRLNITQEDIMIKHDDKVIDYIELVEDANKNSKEMSDAERICKMLNEKSYQNPQDYINNTFIEDDVFLTPPALEKIHFSYSVLEPETNESIFVIYVDDCVRVILSNPKKFSELINDVEIFKFEFYSLKSIRKIINTDILSKEEIYETLTSIFNKSIEESLINIMEG